MPFQEFTNTLSAWIIVIPATLGCFIYSRLDSKAKFILYMTSAACIPQMVYAFRSILTPLVPFDYRSVLNVFYNTNITLELLFLYHFFRGRYTSKRKRRVFRTSLLICIATGLLFSLAFGFSEAFLAKWLVINNLSYTLWTLLLLLEIYEQDSLSSQTSGSTFIFLIGLFFYSSCTVIYFPLRTYLQQEMYLARLGIIHDLLNIFLYTTFALGFILVYRNSIRKWEAS